MQYSINGTDWQTSTAFTGLYSGVYTVLVKDVNGCTGSVIETLTEPNPFVIVQSTLDNNCYGDNSGSATVTASGGSGNMAYSIDGGINYQSSSIFSNLTAGTYTVTIRDGAGCLATTSFSLTQPPTLILSYKVLNVTCHGAKDGVISLFASGGTGAYSYSINGTTYQLSNTFTGLRGATYTGYVKDVNGCVKIVKVIVREPAALNIISTTGDVSCSGGNNGYISLTVNGGTSPDSFIWSNESTTQSIFDLGAGTYSVTVTDNNGCQDTATFSITQPAMPIVVNGVVNDASSSSSTDGGVLASVTGGVTPYTFSWSNGETTQNLTNAGVGTYTLTITDANGCISTLVFKIDVATGIQSIGAATNKVSIYPNPSNDVATVDAAQNIITNLKVVDILGQVVFQSEPKQTKAEIKCNVLAPGVYLVQIQVNGNLINKRLNVVR